MIKFYLLLSLNKIIIIISLYGNNKFKNRILLSFNCHHYPNMSRCNKCLHFNGTSGRQKQIWANKLEDLNSIFPGTQGFVVYTLDANEEAQILLVFSCFILL